MCMEFGAFEKDFVHFQSTFLRIGRFSRGLDLPGTALLSIIFFFRLRPLSMEAEAPCPSTCDPSLTAIAVPDSIAFTKKERFYC